MKKINSSGFVLAETLVVTVFLMAIFAMIYSNFLPLVGEYEKRENYDSVDGKYSVYWIKRMIEDSSYNIPNSKRNAIKNDGYVRFECSDIVDDEEKREFCINIVKDLQVENCDKKGNNCEIFITKYRIGNSTDTTSNSWFKNAVKSNKKRYEENCSGDSCRQSYIDNCVAATSNTEVDRNICEEKADKKIFRSGFKDYVANLPDYSAESLNYAKYRVITSFHNKKDNNNYYSYATIEVSR
jgi:hypothetical protein